MMQRVLINVGSPAALPLNSSAQIVQQYKVHTLAAPSVQQLCQQVQPELEPKASIPAVAVVAAEGPGPWMEETVQCLRQASRSLFIIVR